MFKIMPKLLAGFFVLLPLLILAEISETERTDFIIGLIDKVKWPEDSNKTGEFTISVIGNGDYAAKLREAAARAELKVVVKNVDLDDDFTESQMVVITSTQLSDLAKILKKVRGKPVLTVTESKGFARYGVMVELITEGDKLEYVINKLSAKEAHITINSKLVEKAKATFG